MRAPHVGRCRRRRSRRRWRRRARRRWAPRRRATVSWECGFGCFSRSFARRGVFRAAVVCSKRSQLKPHTHTQHAPSRASRGGRRRRAPARPAARRGRRGSPRGLFVFPEGEGRQRVRSIDADDTKSARVRAPLARTPTHKTTTTSSPTRCSTLPRRGRRRPGTLCSASVTSHSTPRPDSMPTQGGRPVRYLNAGTCFVSVVCV